MELKLEKVRDNIKWNYIYVLQKRKKIKTYILDGYKAYDKVEYENYCKTAKVGRPIKEI